LRGSATRGNLGWNGLPSAPLARILPAMSDAISDAVFAALAIQLQMEPQEIVRRQREALDRLGLDSHGLMRVLLEIERRLRLPAGLEVDDAALESPATLAAGVATAVAGR
jgi:hypothetical protein